MNRPRIEDHYDQYDYTHEQYLDDTDEWVLSEIRRSRGATLGNPPRRVKEYLCTWVGYDGETTWESRERLIDLGYFSRLSAFEATESSEVPDETPDVDVPVVPADAEATADNVQP